MAPSADGFIVPTRLWERHHGNARNSKQRNKRSSRNEAARLLPPLGAYVGGYPRRAAPFAFFGAARALTLSGTGSLSDIRGQPLICRTAANSEELQGAPRQLKLAWNANAACTVAAPVAKERGIFAKHNLDVDFVNFGGTTDQLLEAIATGKADAGLGLALRWLKPLEQGFDVRITAGVHGGCIRLLGSKSANIDSLESMRGKAIGISDQASPAKNFFSIVLAKKGIDRSRDVEWRQYPANLLALAVDKGEVQALADIDPLPYLWLKEGKLNEIATNLMDELPTAPAAFSRYVAASLEANCRWAGRLDTIDTGGGGPSCQ